MPEDRSRHQLILFDIDGTLIYTGGAGGRAMSRAFGEVCCVDDGFAGIPMPGRTDPVILADAFARLPLPPDSRLAERFQQTYLRCLTDELADLPAAAGVLPGVFDLLRALEKRPDTTIALLTGNYAAAARLKLARFGLWQHFAAGAFGEDAADRPGLVDVAIARATAHGMPPVAAADVVVIGDTPLDVSCGKANGNRTVAVATGNYGVDELQDTGADAVVRDLSDAGHVLAVFDAWRQIRL
jgi:phosphoglycolate phosphatase-like HAD superfamily hydrolase